MAAKYKAPPCGLRLDGPMRDVTRKWCNFQLHTNKSNVYYARIPDVYTDTCTCICERAKNGSRCETMYMPLCPVILDILPGKPARGKGRRSDRRGKEGIVDRSSRGPGIVDRPGIPIIAIIRARIDDTFAIHSTTYLLSAIPSASTAR